MLFDVMLCGFFRMVSGMQVVTMRDVGMMPGLFMAPAGMMLGRFFVMAGRMFMVLRRFCMMFCTFLTHMEGISDFKVRGFLVRVSNFKMIVIAANERSKLQFRHNPGGPER